MGHRDNGRRLLHKKPGLGISAKRRTHTRNPNYYYAEIDSVHVYCDISQVWFLNYDRKNKIIEDTDKIYIIGC